ncbi:metal-dependent hydrolase [Natrialbaceae archaeon A-gly3]
MATTHVFVGLTLVVPLAYVYPEFAPPLALGAIVGGLAPDFDVAFEHRRTLHFPVYGGVLAVPTAVVAVLSPSTLTVTLAAFAVAAWLHAASDALGSGPEFDPWKNPTERAVYDHFRGRWIRPRRLIRYDGAPEDAVLAVSLAVPALVVFDGPVQPLVAAGVVVSLLYALVRRRIPEWAADRFQ